MIFVFLCHSQEIAKSNGSKLRISYLIISKPLTIDTHVFTRAIVTLLEMLRTSSIRPVDPISPTSVRQSVSDDVLIPLRSSFWYPKSYRLAV